MSLDEEMDVSGRADLLAKIPLFSEISASHRELLASSSEVLTFGSGQILFRQGEVGNAAYVIIKGEAEVVTEGTEGEISIATIGQYQFIGEIAILIDVPRTATVVATGELSALVISKEMFYRLVTDYPVIAIEIMRELAHRLFATTVQVREVASDLETIQLSG